MSVTIRISPEIYELLQRRATEAQSTPEQIAETVIRLHLGNMVHIEQKRTLSGVQAYLRGTRVAVRHVAAFLKAGHTVEEIVQQGLPHVPPAAIYEAIAFYYDHAAEIEAELAANTQEAALAQLRDTLSPEQFAQVTVQAS